MARHLFLLDFPILGTWWANFSIHIYEGYTHFLWHYVADKIMNEPQSGTITFGLRFITCLVSPILYTPRKIPGLFQPAQHNTQTAKFLVHQHRHAYLAPHSRQARPALILTRRHTTMDHRRERGGSERELVYGADAGRWGV